MSIYIIAEAGVNHNGSLKTAFQLVDAAKTAGVNCVKFQTFKAEKLVSPQAVMADYQKKNIGHDDSQYDMLKKLELSYKDFAELKDYCDSQGIDFLSTPFDLDSIAFLNELGVPFWKVPSGEVTNYPYLRAIGKTKRSVVMSTGMCDLEDIASAMMTLRRFGSEDITLLHCNTEYPTPMQDVNLKSMLTLKTVFSVPVGYSDHTKGIVVPIAAAALGACILEKHFTLDRNMQGPDHKASLEPGELKQMVDAVRNVESALGNGEKRPSVSERKNIAIARKSIVASRSIRQGELFSDDNLTTKRPGTGISPMEWERVIGRTAPRDFAENEMIEC